MIKWKLSVVVYVIAVIGSVSILIDYLSLSNIIYNQSNEIFYLASLDRFKSHVLRNYENMDRFGYEPNVVEFYKSLFHGLEETDKLLSKNYLDSIYSIIPESTHSITNQTLQITDSKLSELIEAKALFSEFKSNNELYVTWGKNIKMILPFIIFVGFLLQGIIIVIDWKELKFK